MSNLHPVFEAILAAHGMPQTQNALASIDLKRKPQRFDAEPETPSCFHLAERCSSIPVLSGDSNTDDRADTWREDARLDRIEREREEANSYRGQL